MAELQTSGQELGALYLEVFFYLESFGFGVQVVNVCHLDTPCGDAEGGILNSLELNY